MKQPENDIDPTVFFADEFAGHDVDPSALNPAPPSGRAPTTRRLCVNLSQCPEDADQIAILVVALGSCPDVYQRNGKLVRIVRVASTEAEAKKHEGAPSIREFDRPALLEHLTRHVEFIRERKGEPVVGRPSKDALLAILGRGEWPSVRPLTGVIETPIFRADGSILQEPGYDVETGYVYAPNEAFPDIAPEPTQIDAVKALALLNEIFVDFPFESEAHRASATAAILTLLARPAIAGSVPAYLYDANCPGTGKTLIADACVKTATGRTAAKAGFPPEEAELEKLMGAIALQGDRVVQFDNLAVPFRGMALDRCLTSVDTVQLRVLGQSAAPVMKWRAVIMATGNNIVIGGDIARRVLFARLVANVERPEEREGWKHPQLLDWIGEQRPALVHAALTVLRAFHVAKRPELGVKELGSFEAWSRLIPRAIVFAGGANCLETQPRVEDGTDPIPLAMAALLQGLHALPEASNGISIAALIKLLYPAATAPKAQTSLLGPKTATTDTTTHSDLREALEILAPPDGGKPNASRIAYRLRSWKGRVVGNLTLTGKADRKNIFLWAVRSTTAKTEAA